MTPAGPANALTVAEVLTRYANEVISAKENAETRQKDLNRIESLKTESWASKSFDEFRKVDVVNFIAELKERGWKKSFERAQKSIRKAQENGGQEARGSLVNATSHLRALKRAKDSGHLDSQWV